MILSIIWLILTIICVVKIVRWWNEFVDIVKEMAGEIDTLRKEVDNLKKTVKVLGVKEDNK